MNSDGGLYDILVRWNPVIELTLTAICFIGSAIIRRDIRFYHRQTRTSWTSQQSMAYMVPFLAGLLILLFFFFSNFF